MQLEAKPEAAPTGLPQETLNDLQSLALFSKPKKFERVNLAARMEELGLHNMFGVESWPDAAPCRQVAPRHAKTSIDYPLSQGIGNKDPKFDGRGLLQPICVRGSAKVRLETGWFVQCRIPV